MVQIRKVTSEEERQKREKKNKIIMSLILAVIMLLSTAGYFVFDFAGSNGDSSGTVNYGDTEFKQNEYGFWSFSYGGNDYATIYNPEELVNITVSGSTSKKISDYAGQPIYISGEPIEDISESAKQEILRNIGGFVSRANYACLESDLNCTREYVVKSCSSDNIIVFKKSQTNSSSVSQDGSCVIIDYALGEEEKAADAFLFKILNII